MTEPLSVVVITFNVERELPACLASVDFADEILVVDSGSNDATTGVAARLGARVVHQEWLGYGRQKQHGVHAARHRWVLCLDADERVSDTLRASIEAEMRAPKFSAYTMARRNRFMGRWLGHGEGYPDWNLRLFDRECAAWSEDPVHEHVLARGPIGRLDGDLLHESEQGLADYLAKQNRYTTLQAEWLYRQGRRVGAVRLVLSPMFRFMKFYFLRLGFLDGVPGFVHIAAGCYNSLVKYAKLRQLWRDTASSTPAPDGTRDPLNTPSR